MGINAGGRRGGGDSSGRRRRPARGQPQKPLRPIENTFPEKKEFRLGEYRIVEEKDDYLVCKGYDPNAKDPFAGHIPTAPAKIKVAKPWLLQRTVPEAAGQQIGSTLYTYDYSDTEYGVRTASWTEDSIELEEEQRIDIPYFADDIITAVEIRENAAVDGMDAEDENGARLSWMDLNVSGRHWKASHDAIFGTLDEDLSEGGSATITLTAGGTGQKTVYERLGLGDNDPLESGTKVGAVWVEGLGYVVLGAGCPA
jgi:hypothetical protein